MKGTALNHSFFAVIFLFAACNVTSQDIESWKSTQKGPDKLAAVLLDDRYTPSLRAEAAKALAEIGQWDKYDKAIEAVDAEPRKAVIEELVPMLIEAIQSGNAPPSPPTAEQVAAKDGLFTTLKYAEGDVKSQVDRTLVEWCVADFNHRFFAGRYSIEVVLEGVGEAAGDQLAEALKPDFLAYDKVTEILTKIGSKESREKAGKNLVAIAKTREGKVEEALLVALGRMGGPDVREFLLDLGANLKIPARVQRGALMSYLQFNLCHKDDLDRLLAIAEDDKQDYMSRNFAYDAIVCTGEKSKVPRLLKLLHEVGADKDNFQNVGVDEILKLEKPETIPDIVREITAEKDPWEKFENLRDFVMVRFTWDNEGKALGPEDSKVVLEKIRPLVSAKEAVARGIAIFTLGLMGDESDIALLKKYTGDGGKLGEWKSKEGEIIGAGGKIIQYEDMNFTRVGEVAKWAIGAIEKRSEGN
jgi:hypothetical protein